MGRPKLPIRFCQLENCNELLRAKGFCKKHWYRWKYNGDPLKLKIERHGYPKNNKEYRTWSHIKTRCFNPKADKYKYYGGRGIKMCDEWRYSFSTFIKDVGKAPSPKHSIDRIDNDGNYEPNNCRWATQKEQNNNKGKYNRFKELENELSINAL